MVIVLEDDWLAISSAIQKDLVAVSATSFNQPSGKLLEIFPSNEFLNDKPAFCSLNGAFAVRSLSMMKAVFLELFGRHRINDGIFGRRRTNIENNNETAKPGCAWHLLIEGSA
jgi:hypothetical protein